MLSEFMTQLQKEAEMKRPFEMEGTNICHIPLSEEQIITIEEAPEGLHFEVKITELPEGEKGSAFLKQLLLANLMGQGTHGATLGLTEDGKQMILRRTCQEHLSYRDFIDRLEDFINIIDFWQEEVNNLKLRPILIQ